MKYLSFDIECCDGAHICEFGYVLIDEQFNVLEKNCLTMNPEQEFKLTGRVHQSDIQLAFSEEVYRNSPTFDFYYEKIKQLLTMEDCQIVGFSMKDDADFLCTAYENYWKEPVPFEFLDMQKLYQGYSKMKGKSSLLNMAKQLNVEDIHFHKSVDDAWAVVRALEEISKKEKLSLPSTLTLLKEQTKNYQAEQARLRHISRIEKLKSGNEKAQKEYIKNFIKKLSLAETKKDEFYFGKIVCISSKLQYEHFNEFLGVVERLYSFGATYIGKASVCDLFIDFGNENKDEARYVSANRAINEESREITIISLEKILYLKE